MENVNMGLFKTAWQIDYSHYSLSKSKSMILERKALKVVEKTNNQAKLAQIAREAPGWKVRENAIKKLLDQSVLIDIASNADEHDDFRLLATKKLTDKDIQQEAYAKIAKDEQYNHGKLTKAVSYALSEITDQRILINIAKQAKSRWTREAAVEKLTDKDVLAELAAKMECAVIRLSKLRSEEAKKINNQEELTHIAQYSNDRDICIDAASRLVDKAIAQEVFFRHAMTGADGSIYKPAFDLLTDQTLVARLAIKSLFSYDSGVSLCGQSAVDKLTDQRLLFDVVKKANDWRIREYAVGKLTDCELLREIIDGDEKQSTKTWDSVEYSTGWYDSAYDVTHTVDLRKTALQRFNKL
jgi:hypothetical protein